MATTPRYDEVVHFKQPLYAHNAVFVSEAGVPYATHTGEHTHAAQMQYLLVQEQMHAQMMHQQMMASQPHHTPHMAHQQQMHMQMQMQLEFERQQQQQHQHLFAYHPTHVTPPAATAPPPPQPSQVDQSLSYVTPLPASLPTNHDVLARLGWTPVDAVQCADDGWTGRTSRRRCLRCMYAHGGRCVAGHCDTRPESLYMPPSPIHAAYSSKSLAVAGLYQRQVQRLLQQRRDCTEGEADVLNTSPHWERSGVQPEVTSDQPLLSLDLNADHVPSDDGAMLDPSSADAIATDVSRGVDDVPPVAPRSKKSSAKVRERAPESIRSPRATEERHAVTKRKREDTDKLPIASVAEDTRPSKAVPAAAAPKIKKGKKSRAQPPANAQQTDATAAAAREQPPAAPGAMIQTQDDTSIAGGVISGAPLATKEEHSPLTAPAASTADPIIHALAPDASALPHQTAAPEQIAQQESAALLHVHSSEPDVGAQAEPPSSTSEVIAEASISDSHLYLSRASAPPSPTADPPQTNQTSDTGGAHQTTLDLDRTDDTRSTSLAPQPTHATHDAPPEEKEAPRTITSDLTHGPGPNGPADHPVKLALAAQKEHASQQSSPSLLPRRGRRPSDASATAPPSPITNVRLRDRSRPPSDLNTAQSPRMSSASSSVVAESGDSSETSSSSEEEEEEVEPRPKKRLTELDRLHLANQTVFRAEEAERKKKMKRQRRLAAAAATATGLNHAAAGGTAAATAEHAHA